MQQTLCSRSGASEACSPHWQATSKQLPACRVRSLQYVQRKPHLCFRSSTTGAALPTQVQGVLQAAESAHPGLAPAAVLVTGIFTAAAPLMLKGLTLEGLAHAWLLGTVVLGAFGWGGFSLVALYFIFGTAVTKLKLEQKQKEGIAEARSGRRGPTSVWGSGSAGAFCAAMGLATGNFSLWQIGFVASFTSKLSDTVSSEVGKAYGKTTYLITTLQLVPRGTEGAVSLEGTLAGLGAAAVFAASSLAVGQAAPADAAVITAAAFLANLFESYLGAVVQGRMEWLNNDMVNVIQISVAAGLAVLAKHYCL